MSNPRALIIDDEPDIRELLEITLARMEIDTESAEDLASARRLLATRPFQLCLADLRLPDGDGLELVRLIAAEYPQTPVAVITAHGNMEIAIEALKAGAFDFVSKPVDLQGLRKLVQDALALPAEPPASARPGRDDGAASRPADHRLLGNSAAIERVRALIAKVARSQAPVHIAGESGTGKELAARLIHEQGPRRNAPFIAVNCGAIPRELVESEFFGHVRGSFTGAVRDNEGLFQAAEGGTLFLDEVGDLPLPMQVKLLRAIQERAIRPVGAARELAVDVRIISATHHDLAAQVRAGQFRQDLYFRINVIELTMPPLRERRSDIPGLAQHFLARIAQHSGQPAVTLSAEAEQTLGQYPFPGNVRELENLLERASALCDDGTIGAEDLGLLAPDGGALAHPAGALALPAGSPMPPAEAANAATTPSNAQPPQAKLEDHLAEVERRMILDALETTRWNRTAAAKRLGISFRALRYRLEKLALDEPPE